MNISAIQAATNNVPVARDDFVFTNFALIYDDDFIIDDFASVVKAAKAKPTMIGFNSDESLAYSEC